MVWYPLMFDPIFKEKIWGGDKLNHLKDLATPIKNLGESWEISDVSGDVSVVSEGELKGKSLQWLLQNHAIDLMGDQVHKRFGKEFPILIKYIDTAQDLSIQLHPDDQMAREKNNSFGKTEMWYVMQAHPDARLVLGFKEDCDEFAFAKAIQNKSITTLLNNHKVAAGDSFFIKPGFIHAIGAGVTLAEIQQTSDVTYRVYDYDRLDDEGKPRELHVQDSIAAADYSKASDFQLTYDPHRMGMQELKKTSYFETSILHFEKEIEIPLKFNQSFTILMNVGHDCHLKHGNMSYVFKNSQTYLIPAAIKSIHATVMEKGKLLVVQL